MSHVKIKFDENQEHQVRAVSAVVDLFDGLSRVEDDCSLESLASSDTISNTEEVFEESWLLENLSMIQKRNGLAPQFSLCAPNSGDTLLCDGSRLDFHSYPEFTINMETGTGKTYVYLRTIYA